MAQDSIAAGVWPPSARLPDGSVPAAPDAAIQGQPNILIIMVDQMRIPRWLPAAGDAGIAALDETIYPNIAGLRNQSFSFYNYFTAANNCTPARATILTRLYSQQQGMFLSESGSQSPALQQTFPTFGSALSDPSWLTGLGLQNYDTAWIGKWHLSNTPLGPNEPYGFVNPDCLPNSSTHSPDGYSNEATMGGQSPYPNTIDDNQILGQYQIWATHKTANNPTQPWLCVVSFVNPHDIAWAPAAYGLGPPNFVSPGSWPPAPPYFSPPDVHGGTDAGTPPYNTYPALPTPFTALPVGYMGQPWNGNDPAIGVPYANGNASQPAKPDLQSIFQYFVTQGFGSVVPYSQNQPEWQAGWITFLNYYYWMHHCVDNVVGGVLNSLQSSQYTFPNGTHLGDNTIVIFMADHGEYAGSHSLHDKGGAAYDEALNVPLYISFPTQRSGAPQEIQRYQMVSSVDLMAFLLTLASGSSAWRASSPWTYLSGREAIEDFLYYQHPDQRRGVSVNGQMLPYILYTYDQNKPSEYLNYTYDQASLPYHVIALRTLLLPVNGGYIGGKIASYDIWPNCSTQPQAGNTQWEFYDYATGNLYELGNDYFSSNPGTQQDLATFQGLISTSGPNSVLPGELYAIPSSLISANSAALVAYFTYLGQNGCGS